MKPLKYLLLILLISACLSSCNSLINLAQPIQTDMATISPNANVGQTLMATYRGLQGIAVFLSPQTSLEGTLRLHLRSGPEAANDISVVDVSLDKINKPQFVSFNFPLQTDSFKKDYYFYIELLGSGEIGISKAPGDTYLNGAMYINHTAEDAQLAFRLKYDRYQAFIGICREVLSWLWFTLIGILLYILPGWALLSLLFRNWTSMSWGEKLGLSSGMSLAIYPILFLWTDIIGLHLGPLYAWIPVVFGIVTISWKNRHHLKVNNLKFSYTQNAIADLAFIIVIILVVAVRFLVIRTLDAPMWGDSVQHTVMAQLILDNGGLFKSWVPYAPYNSLTVQFGFPAFSALYTWVTELSNGKATLIVGQIINGLAVIALYPLAVRIANGNRWAGVGAVLVAGLLSPMPAFYVNWGRYALLAGQTILPVALLLGWEVLEYRRAYPEFVEGMKDEGRSQLSTTRYPPLAINHQLLAIGLSALVLSGMMLTYYRMPFYYATFILALLAGCGIPEWRRDWRVWAGKLGILLAVAVLSGFLFLPWGMRLFGSHLAGAVEAGVTSGAPVDVVRTDYQVWRSLFAYVHEAMVAVALAGLAWSLARKHWMVAAQGLWVALLSAVIAGGLIRLPGANMMQTFAVLIYLYIPIGLVIGWMIAEIAGRGSGRTRQSLVAIFVFVVAILGALDQRNTAIPANFAYVTRPDTRAMVWIREHLPGDAHFLVEGYGIYGGKTIVGGDAGWWIPLLAHRQNTMPPQYAILNESPIQPDFTQRMVALVKNLETIPLDSPEGVRLLCGEGVTHVYIGQGQGKIGFNAIQLFSPDELLDSQDYSLLYHQDRVYVFALKAGICP